MIWPDPPQRDRLIGANVVNEVIANDLREQRTKAGVTLETLGDLFQEQRAVISKHEKGVNQIHVAKYLLIMDFLKESCPRHPAHILIKSIGRGRLRAMISDDAPQARLAGYLELMDATREACPSHPALPLCDYLLYRRE